MNLFIFLRGRALIQAGIFLIIGMLTFPSAQESDGITFGVAGWMQYGIIAHSSDTGTLSVHNKLNGKGVLSGGAQVNLSAKPSEHLSVYAGLGAASGNTLPIATTVNSGYAPSGVDAYVANAYFTYLFQNSPKSKLSVTGGLFPYDYNPDVKNLGLYLLRGPVYPGILISGFETKHVMPVANMLGLQVHHQMGGFQQDILLSSEMEFYPFFDLSPAYVASYQIHPSFRVGAGANFYHLISVDNKLTSGVHGSAYQQWQYVDTAGGKSDTTDLGYKGIKLMANVSIDPKPLIGGMASLGSEDLKLYGEVALLGLENSIAYKNIYGDYLHRMPVMVGFNLPVFKKLDHLSMEVEWYGSPNEDNLDGYRIVGESQPVTPYPTNWNSSSYTRLRTSTRDNWKWSLHGSRTIQKHVLLSFQFADDHYRPGLFDGYADQNPPHRNAVLVTPKDWYFTTKLAYFF